MNGDLQVGALEESVTVTGATPTVDVINNQSQFVANRDILDAIPTPIRNTPARALLLPGTTVTPFVLGQYNMSVHGSSTADMVIAIDGLRVNNLCGSGQFSGFYMNDASVQEVTFTTGAESAEMQNGGLRINSTPKDGGNTFSGTLLRLRRRQPAAGRQPLRRGQGGRHSAAGHRLYLRRSTRRSAARSSATSCGSTSPTNTRTTRPTSPAPTFADGSRRSARRMGNYSAVTRLTWQATQRDKVRFYLDRQFNGEFYNGFNTLPTTITRSVDRRVRAGLGAAGEVDADHHQQAAARGRASRTTRRTTSRTADRKSARATSRAWNRRPTG